MLTSFLREKLSGSGMPLTCTIYDMIFDRIGDCGGTVVKVLCYKLEGRWFNPT